MRRRGAFQRLEILAALATVGGDHPPSETAQRLCDLAVPAFADLAALDVAVGDQITRLAARFEGPNQSAVEHALLHRRTLPEGWATGSHHAFRTGTVNELKPITRAALEAIAATPEDLEALLGARLTTGLFLPLAAGGRPIGALTLVRRKPRRRFGAEEVRFAQAFAGRAALVLDRASLHARLEQSEGRLERIFGQLDEAIVLQDEWGQVVWANEAAARILLVPSASMLVGADMENVNKGFELFREDGSPLAVEELPRMRVLRDGESSPLLFRSVIRATGELRWLRSTASLLVEGNHRYAIAVVEDVTELTEAGRAERLLAQAGEVIGAARDDRELLTRIAGLLVPDLADFCRVDSPGPHGEIETVAVAHADPEKVALGWKISREHPIDPAREGGVAAVMRTGRHELIQEVSEEMLSAVAQDERHGELLRAVGFGAVLIVPMLAAGEVVGVVSLARTLPRRRFESRDVVLAEELGRRLGTAVQTARLYRERTRIADTLQAAFLPPEPRERPGWAFAASYHAAGDANQVGGDFYDVVDLPGGGFFAVVGDVAGKGASAAALTARARHVLATAIRLTGDPVRALDHLNTVLQEGPEVLPVTLACVHCPDAKSGRVAVAAAGHPPPYVVRASGKVELLDVRGPILGSVDAWPWPLVDVELASGDSMLLYTDGVIDAHGATERFGEDRLAQLVAGMSEATPDELVGALDAALAAFSEGPQRDDVAVLALGRSG